MPGDLHLTDSEVDAHEAGPIPVLERAAPRWIADTGLQLDAGGKSMRLAHLSNPDTGQPRQRLLATGEAKARGAREQPGEHGPTTLGLPEQAKAVIHPG